MKPFLVASLLIYILSLSTAIIHLLGGAKGRWARPSGTASRALLALGLLIHTAALVERMASTGHAPMASMYETLVFYAWTTVLVSTVVAYRYAERSTGLVTVSLASLAVAFALFNESPGGPLTPVLRTVWFEVHVISSFAGYALFTLAFAGALLYLLSDARGVAQELAKYQDIAGRSVLWGFFLFSASMFSGAVWAYLAWGAYWLWEPKVIWSFIVWFYYAGAMHAYYVKEWRGRGLAVATVCGFFVVLFTYLGVSLLMKSSHSF
jgi:ABC-type transport system involved in cytochrome c biogenesis permease subunit